MAAVLLRESVLLGSDLPVAVGTRFGFVVMVAAPFSLNCSLACVEDLSGYPMDMVSVHMLHRHFHNDQISLVTLSTSVHSMENMFQRFWEVEELPALPRQASEQDSFAEHFYNNTTERLPSGRYRVPLLFFDNPSGQLDDSFKGAFSRFLALERFPADGDFRL